MDYLLVFYTASMVLSLALIMIVIIFEKLNKNHKRNER